jgi:hypothetical protein
MKKWLNSVFTVIVTIACFAMSSLVYAKAILNIVPNSTNIISLTSTGNSSLTYTVTNNTQRVINNITIDPNYNISGNPINLVLQDNHCAALAPFASCTFGLLIRGVGQHANVALMPRVCGYNGLTCSYFRRRFKYLYHRRLYKWSYGKRFSVAK